MNDRASMAANERSAVGESMALEPARAELPAAAGGRELRLRPWFGLALSLVLLAALTALKFVWAKQFGSAPTYLLYFAVILVGAWYGGVRVGLLVTALAAWVGHALFADAGTSVSSLPGMFRLASFGVEGAAISVLAAYAQRGRARAAEAARQAELSSAKLRSVLGAVADGITVQDASGRLIYANGPAAELTGFESAEAILAASPEQIMERYEIFGPDGQPFPVAELPGRNVLRGLPAPERLIRFRLRQTGEERWSLVRANPV
ncbi:MAG TPA: DUF4118 domain-containing protein, partial [Polyangiales bacterium]|nr:DUF4118 domain-containing protein [Polyangiales bacterium]